MRGRKRRQENEALYEAYVSGVRQFVNEGQVWMDGDPGGPSLYDKTWDIFRHQGFLDACDRLMLSRHQWTRDEVERRASARAVALAQLRAGADPAAY